MKQPFNFASCKVYCMSTTESNDGKDHLGAEVPKDLKKRVRVAAAERDMSMSEFLRTTLEEATSE